MSLPQRLLRLSLDADKAEALIGDLEEEAARLDAPPAWIRRQALQCAISAARLAVHRQRIRMLTTTRLAFRDARRSILRFRGTSLAAVFILSLSMAAGAVTFAVVDTIVVRPLPYADSDRLVAISVRTPREARATLAPVDYYTSRARTSSFDSLAAWRTWAFQLTDDRGTEPATMVITTASLFDVLRARPVIGTVFTEEHETPGRDAVAVISHGLWQRRYGGDPGVLGGQVGTPTGTVTVIGVMPPGFGFPVEAESPPAIWRPFAPKAEERVITPEGGRASYLRVIGRLQEGVSLDQARADVDRVFGSLAAEHAGMYDDLQPRTERLLDTLTDRVAGWMQLVLAAVAVLMAIGCVNVSNLLLTRSAQRARDISIRLSLGASRAQVMAALLAESLLLAAASTAAGLLAAHWLLAIVKSALPPGIVRADAVQLDARVFAACAIAGALTALIAGLTPGWHASRVAPAQVLKNNAGATPAPARRRGQSTLLVAQVALVTTLVVAAMLLVGSFARVVSADLGFSRHNLAGVRLTPPAQAGADKASALRDFYIGAEERVAAVPGVTSVAMLGGSSLPLYRGSSSGTRISTADGTASPVAVDFRRVSTGYFETAGIPILEGRAFAPGDRDQPVAVIDELAARHLFEGRSAIGQRLRPGGVTIIGVAANVRLLGPEGASQAQMYRLLDDTTGLGRVLLIRTSEPVAAVVPAIQAALAELTPGTRAAVKVDIVEDQFRLLTADRRFNAGVMSALGLLALLIAASGIYATTASMVAQRTKEIGIRMALGASAGGVVQAITATTARLLLAGAALGLAAAWAASGFLESVVFGVRPTDALTYLVPLAIIAASGCLAAVLPALKAARIDPLMTLRSE
ncbi:ABC transporter permease [soil metagenome]